MEVKNKMGKKLTLNEKNELILILSRYYQSEWVKTEIDMEKVLHLKDKVYTLEEEKGNKPKQSEGEKLILQAVIDGKVK